MMPYLPRSPGRIAPFAPFGAHFHPGFSSQLKQCSPFYSMSFWAFDQFCLNSRPIPLEVWVQSVSARAEPRPLHPESPRRCTLDVNQETPIKTAATAFDNALADGKAKPGS